MDNQSIMSLQNVHIQESSRKPNVKTRMFTKLQKHQISPFLKKYFDFMEKQEEISVKLTAQLYNWSHLLMASTLQSVSGRTLVNCCNGPLRGKDKNDFLASLHEDLDQYLSSSDMPDKMINAKLYFLCCISNVPINVYKQWFDSFKPKM